MVAVAVAVTVAAMLGGVYLSFWSTAPRADNHLLLSGAFARPSVAAIFPAAGLRLDLTGGGLSWPPQVSLVNLVMLHREPMAQGGEWARCR